MIELTIAADPPMTIMVPDGITLFLCAVAATLIWSFVWAHLED